jgi:hypothetical protein
MTTFRNTGHDVRHPASKPKFRPNDAPSGRVGIYNTKGQRVGHIGPHGGASIVSKILGGAPAEVGKVKGRPAWIATAPSRTNAVTRAANAKLAKSLKTDRGSVSSKR